MARKVIVFQHNPWEKPGQFLVSALKSHHIKMEVIRVWKEAIPALNGYMALIVLGGGPNVDQEHLYPFLAEEKKVIRNAIARDMPYLGFCLGHQLLADALGAEVGANFQSSIGYIKGFLTHDGRIHPAFKGLPQEFPLFKWHAQAVLGPLPGHINILATSSECQVEAISVHERPHIIGLQFDNHAANQKNVQEWLTMDSKWLASLKDFTLNPAAIIDDASRNQANIRNHFAKLCDNFFALIQ